MSKQDRQGVRTPTDLERKYNLGRMAQTFAEVREQSSGMREEVANLANDLRNEFTQQIAIVDMKVETAGDDIESLTKDLGELQSETDRRLTEASNSLASTKEGLEGDISTLETDVENLKTAVSGIETDMGNLESETDRKISEFNESITGQIDGLRTAMEESDTATEKAIDELTSAIETVTDTANATAANVEGVINDVNNHFDFTEGGMTFKGGINPALIPAEADLDGLLIPNKYIGGTVTQFNYLNCPVSSGTFLLEVDLCGDQGQLKQTLSYCDKTLGRVYERYFYGTSWGAWVCVTDFAEASKLLWADGAYYMTASQTVNLPETISSQKQGIVLAFSECVDGAATDNAWHCFFIPKAQVAQQPGGGYTFTLATSKLAHVGTKQVFIYNDKITGHADNDQTGTGESGVKFTNNRFVLRYVFGY